MFAYSFYVAKITVNNKKKTDCVIKKSKKFIDQFYFINTNEKSLNKI